VFIVGCGDAEFLTFGKVGVLHAVGVVGESALGFLLEDLGARGAHEGREVVTHFVGQFGGVLSCLDAFKELLLQVALGLVGLE